MLSLDPDALVELSEYMKDSVDLLSQVLPLISNHRYSLADSVRHSLKQVSSSLVLTFY
jgi:hypothetical protein